MVWLISNKNENRHILIFHADLQLKNYYYYYYLNELASDVRFTFTYYLSSQYKFNYYF